jgi:BirA family biotin operon repressor/biotin-[acetyl-CoA-carboxylase] ligase
MDRALASTPFSGKLHHFAEIDSTNTHAMREVEKGAPHGSVFFADAQTAGRGRGAHTWASPPGSGLYVSVLLRPSSAQPMSPADALWLSLAAGLAVRSAVLDVSGLSADLRWPNDLLFGARKFSGILLEMHAEVTRVRHVVIGIGINVHQRAFPPELRDHATSLAIESGRDYSRQALLVSLLLALHRELDALARSRSAHSDILSRLEAQSTWIRGKRVAVDEDGGYSGVTAGLDAQGFLLVNTTAGTRTVRSGGVRGEQEEHS